MASGIAIYQIIHMIMIANEIQCEIQCYGHMVMMHLHSFMNYDNILIIKRY